MSYSKKIIACVCSLTISQQISAACSTDAYQINCLLSLNADCAKANEALCQKETPECCSLNPNCMKGDAPNSCVSYTGTGEDNDANKQKRDNVFLGLHNSLFGPPNGAENDPQGIVKGDEYYKYFIANNTPDVKVAAFNYVVPAPANVSFWNLDQAFWKQDNAVSKLNKVLSDAKDSGLQPADLLNGLMLANQVQSTPLNICILSLSNTPADTEKIKALMDAYSVNGQINKDQLKTLLTTHNMTSETRYSDTPFSLAIRNNLPNVFDVLVNSCKNAGMTRDDLYAILAEKDKEGKTTTEAIASVANSPYQNSIDTAFAPPTP